MAEPVDQQAMFVEGPSRGNKYNSKYLVDEAQEEAQDHRQCPTHSLDVICTSEWSRTGESTHHECVWNTIVRLRSEDQLQVQRWRQAMIQVLNKSISFFPTISLGAGC